MATKDQQEAEFARLMASDPEIRGYIAHLQSLEARGWDETAINQFLKWTGLRDKMQTRATALGVDAKRWMPEWKQGQGLTVNHQNWIERNPNKAAAIAAGGIFGGIGLAGGFAGAPAAAGGSAAPSAAGTGAGAAAYGAPAPVIGGSAGTAGAPAYGGAVAGGGGSAAAGGAAAGSKFGQLAQIFKNPDVLNTAIQGVGGYFLNKSKQNAIEAAREDMQKATDEALRRNDEATAVAKDVYNTQRNDLAPYRQIGSSSIGALNTLMGFGGGGGGGQAAINHPMTPQPGQPIAHPMTSQPGQPTGHPVSLGQMGPSKPMQTMPQAATGMQAGANLSNVGAAVRLKAPDGEVRLVPREMAQQLIARGAVAV